MGETDRDEVISAKCTAMSLSLFVYIESESLFLYAILCGTKKIKLIIQKSKTKTF